MLCCKIRSIIEEDVPVLFSAFHELGWDKPASLFESYLEEQRLGKRHAWVAFNDTAFAGYVTLTWTSLYPPFRDENVPEIMDLNVLPSFRNRGIGTQ